MGIKKYVTLQSQTARKWFAEKARFSIPLSVKLGHFIKGIKSE